MQRTTYDMIEIDTLANGWLVMVGDEPTTDHHFFATFEALVDFLKANLSAPIRGGGLQ